MVEFTVPNGVEIVREIEDSGEGEEVYLFKTEEVLRIGLGATAGHEVYTETQYFLVVDVDLDADEMVQMMTGKDYIDEGIVCVSNEDGEVGHAFIRDDGLDAEEALATFAEQYL